VVQVHEPTVADDGDVLAREPHAQRGSARMRS
jgi:hypothetical protein